MNLWKSSEIAGQSAKLSAAPDVTRTHLQMSDGANTQAVYLSLFVSGFLLAADNQSTRVLICCVWCLYLHRDSIRRTNITLRLSVFFFNNTHTSLSVSPFFFSLPQPPPVSLCLRLPFKFQVISSLRVCLSRWVGVCLSFCARLREGESGLCVFCEAGDGCVCVSGVCLRSRSGVKTNHFKSPSRASCVCLRLCVCVCVCASKDNLHWCCCQIGERALELFKHQLSAAVHALARSEASVC